MHRAGRRRGRRGETRAQRKPPGGDRGGHRDDCRRHDPRAPALERVLDAQRERVRSRLAVEVGEHVARALVAQRRVDLEAAPDDALEVLRDSGGDLAHRARPVREAHHHLRHRSVRLVGQLPGQHLVEDHAEREDVGRRARPNALHLLGRHVVGRPDDGAGRGHAGAVGGAGDPEVHEMRAARARGHHHVLGLEVAVHDALRVGFLEGAQDLAGERQHLAHGERAAAADRGLQAFALDVLHREELDPLRLAEVEDADHVLVRHLAREHELLLEARERLGAFRGVEPDRLERDQLVELAVARLVDAAHAALAEDRHDLVAVAEDGSEHELARRRDARGPPRAPRGRAQRGEVVGADLGRRAACATGGRRGRPEVAAPAGRCSVTPVCDVASSNGAPQPSHSVRSTGFSRPQRGQFMPASLPQPRWPATALRVRALTGTYRPAARGISAGFAGSLPLRRTRGMPPTQRAPRARRVRCGREGPGGTR